MYSLLQNCFTFGAKLLNFGAQGPSYLGLFLLFQLSFLQLDVIQKKFKPNQLNLTENYSSFALTESLIKKEYTTTKDIIIRIKKIQKYLRHVKVKTFLDHLLIKYLRNYSMIKLKQISYENKNIVLYIQILGNYQIIPKILSRKIDKLIYIEQIMKQEDLTPDLEQKYLLYPSQSNNNMIVLIEEQENSLKSTKHIIEFISKNTLFQIQLELYQIQLVKNYYSEMLENQQFNFHMKNLKITIELNRIIIFGSMKQAKLIYDQLTSFRDKKIVSEKMTLQDLKIRKYLSSKKVIDLSRNVINRFFEESNLLYLSCLNLENEKIVVEFHCLQKDKIQLNKLSDLIEQCFCVEEIMKMEQLTPELQRKYLLYPSKEDNNMIVLIQEQQKSLTTKSQIMKIVSTNCTLQVQFQQERGQLIKNYLNEMKINKEMMSSILNIKITIENKKIVIFGSRIYAQLIYNQLVKFIDQKLYYSLVVFISLLKIQKYLFDQRVKKLVEDVLTKFFSKNKIVHLQDVEFVNNKIKLNLAVPGKYYKIQQNKLNQQIQKCFYVEEIMKIEQLTLDLQQKYLLFSSFMNNRVVLVEDQEKCVNTIKQIMKVISLNFTFQVPIVKFQNQKNIRNQINDYLNELKRNPQKKTLIQKVKITIEPTKIIIFGRVIQAQIIYNQFVKFIQSKVNISFEFTLGTLKISKYLLNQRVKNLSKNVINNFFSKNNETKLQNIEFNSQKIILKLTAPINHKIQQKKLIQQIDKCFVVQEIMKLEQLTPKLKENYLLYPSFNNKNMIVVIQDEEKSFNTIKQIMKIIYKNGTYEVTLNLEKEKQQLLRIFLEKLQFKALLKYVKVVFEEQKVIIFGNKEEAQQMYNSIYAYLNKLKKQIKHKEIILNELQSKVVEKNFERFRKQIQESCKLSFARNKKKSFGAFLSISPENSIKTDVEVSAFYIKKDSKYFKLSKKLFKTGQQHNYKCKEIHNLYKYQLLTQHASVGQLKLQTSKQLINLINSCKNTNIGTELKIYIFIQEQYDLFKNLKKIEKDFIAEQIYTKYIVQDQQEIYYYSSSGEDKIIKAVQSNQKFAYLTSKDLNLNGVTHRCSLKQRKLIHKASQIQTQIVQHLGDYYVKLNDEWFTIPQKQIRNVLNKEKSHSIRNQSRNENQVRGRGRGKYRNNYNYVQEQSYGRNKSQDEVIWVDICFGIYKIDFQNMKQINLFSGFSRDLKKKQFKKDNSKKIQISQFDQQINFLSIPYHEENETSLKVAETKIKKLIQTQIIRQKYSFSKSITPNQLLKLETLAEKIDIFIDCHDKFMMVSGYDRMKINNFILNTRLILSSQNQIQYPKTWTEIKLNQIKLFEVGKKTKQFEQVQQIFTKGPIKQLLRIQNQIVYRRYYEEKLFLNQLNGGKPVKEMMLFHGTSTTNPKIIYEDKEQCFNINFNSNDSNYLGRATYFAESSQYSHDYSFLVPEQKYQSRLTTNPNNKIKIQTREMLYCSVLVGDSQKIATVDDKSKGMKDTDYKDVVNKIKYQSSTTYSGGSIIYAVYKNKRAYPHYLIRY